MTVDSGTIPYLDGSAQVRLLVELLRGNDEVDLAGDVVVAEPGVVRDKVRVALRARLDELTRRHPLAGHDAFVAGMHVAMAVVDAELTVDQA